MKVTYGDNVRHVFETNRDGRVLYGEEYKTLPECTIAELADIALYDWRKVYFGAGPYLNAMFELESVTDSYGADSGRGIVAYFLANAGTWRGATARAVKAELKRRIAGKGRGR